MLLWKNEKRDILNGHIKNLCRSSPQRNGSLLMRDRNWFWCYGINESHLGWFGLPYT